MMLSPVRGWFVPVLFSFALASGTCPALAQESEPDRANPLSDALVPDSTFSPSEVVRVQLEALRHNDEQDRGIAVAFRFASPANRGNTGPLSRFIAMIKEGPYALMLGFREAAYGPVETHVRPGPTAGHADRHTGKRDLLVLSVQAVGSALRGLLDDRCRTHRARSGTCRIGFSSGIGIGQGRYPVRRRHPAVATAASESPRNAGMTSVANNRIERSTISIGRPPKFIQHTRLLTPASSRSCSSFSMQV